MENHKESQNFDRKEKKFYPPKTHQRFLNKNFPFNYRYFVPDFELENMQENPDYVRVISYNILCDSLVSISTEIDENDLINYPYMLWQNRKKKIIEELNELNGDIICLQEFERDEEMIQTLGKMGYDVIIS